MRLYELVTVQMRNVSEGRMAVLETKVTVNLDAVCGLVPATVPSEITGTDGQPVGIPACTVMLPGGQLLVKMTYQEMKELLEGPKVVL